MEHEMKKRVKQLLYSSLAAFISIIVNFDTEARVTREVAEAALPYLMEAAGIPSDADEENVVLAKEVKYKKDKIQAILNMIYTDEGQRQMVKWVQDGKFPNILKAQFNSSNVYESGIYRKVTLASLFPCTTGTFTSFSNNIVRLGKHILTRKLQTELPKIISKVKEGKNPELILQNVNHPLLPKDILLAKIIFILDILDDTIGLGIITPVARNILKEITTSKYEYMCRPVSAIIAKKSVENYEGDCVETLYRHLLNIAVQDPQNLSRFHIERLPSQLQNYYNLSNYPENKADPEGMEIKQKSEAGLTEISKHNEWESCLGQWVKDNGLNIDISTGALINIANILNLIAFSKRIDCFKIEYAPLYIQDAMNKLAALKDPKDIRFIVSVTHGLLEQGWINTKITINDCHARR